jgi:hypothetical protein
MRFGSVLFSALSLAVAGQAQAGGWSEPCDWFQNATIGTRCAQSVSISTELNYQLYDYQSSYPFILQYLKSTDEHFFPGAEVTVTPTSWLTLEVRSKYGFDDHQWTYTNPLGVFPNKSSEAYAYRQTVIANVNMLDTGPGGQRFVLNSFLGGFIVPSHDGYSTETAVFGGLTANYQVRLGSGLSIDAQGQLEADSRSPDGNVLLYPSARLLLSADKLGVAIGPNFESYQWLSSGHGVSPQSDYYAAGGTVIVQPFRSSQSPLLNGIILQGSAEHSIGQANFVPAGEAKTDQLDVSGTVSFHFRY